MPKCDVLLNFNERSYADFYGFYVARKISLRKCSCEWLHSSAEHAKQKCMQIANSFLFLLLRAFALHSETRYDSCQLPKETKDSFQLIPHNGIFFLRSWYMKSLFHRRKGNRFLANVYDWWLWGGKLLNVMKCTLKLWPRRSFEQAEWNKANCIKSFLLRCSAQAGGATYKRQT